MSLNTTRHSNIPFTSVFSGPTVVTGGSITQQVYGSITKGGFEQLVEASSPAAFHNSEKRLDPPKCHPNTRVGILQRITDWVVGISAGPGERRSFMMWLYGSAGVGKSAIAQTIAELFEDDGSLLASFFFSRTDPTRNHARQLFATIAYQVALTIPETKIFIVEAIERDPLIFSKSYETQFARLIVEPLQSAMCSNDSNSQKTYLIVIDGLDECTDKDARSNILRLLMNAHQKHPPVLRFLIASRPDLDIRTIIDSHSLEARPSRLGLDGDYMSDQDIRFFLQAKFQEIKKHHPHRAFVPTEWPSHSTIDKLVQTSSGQFIYASTVVKYLTSPARKPTTSLDIILGLHPARSEAPFAALDELYIFIFSTVNDIDLVLQALGLIILCECNFTFQLERILGLEGGDIEICFSALGSIISVVDKRLVKILHASLEDFLLDNTRSKDLYLNPPLKHAKYACLYLKRIILDPRRYNFKQSVDALIYNLERAFLTHELHRDISQFPLGKVYLAICETGQQKPFFDFVPLFLSSVKALQGEGAIYSHEEHFDGILRGTLGAYYTNPQLAFVVTMLPIIESIGHFNRDLEGLLTDLIGDVAIEVDRTGLCILRHGCGPPYSPFGKYYQYLSAFIEDPTRSGSYALTEARYAEAALYLYQHTRWSSQYLPDVHLDIFIMLLNRAGKSPWLLGEITNCHADFKSRMQLEKSSWLMTEERSKRVQLAEDAVENYIRKMGAGNNSISQS